MKKYFQIILLLFSILSFTHHAQCNEGTGEKNNPFVDSIIVAVVEKPVKFLSENPTMETKSVAVLLALKVISEMSFMLKMR